MAKHRTKRNPRSAPRNQRRERLSFGEIVGGKVRRVTAEATNQRSGRREGRTVLAAIAATEADLPPCNGEPAGFFRMLPRNLLGLPLLPVCWVTLWTLMWQFKGACNESFWLSVEFWNFAIGVLVMIGWFASGLLANFFLCAYVLGHELTHYGFVLLCGGKVMDFDYGVQGGYVTTTKTNWLIALSPYFVPFWSVVLVALYSCLRCLWWFVPEWGPLSPQVERVFYLLLGLTWTFHMAWTLWMIPKDQPDLKENGTLLSLSVIMLGNLLVLTLLFCLSGKGGVLANFDSFARDWSRHALQMGEAGLRAFRDWVEGTAMRRAL